MADKSINDSDEEEDSEEMTERFRTDRPMIKKNYADGSLDFIMQNDESLQELVKTRNDRAKKLDTELQQHERMTVIEKKLKRAGTDPKSIMLAPVKQRNWLDHLKIPMRFELSCGCLGRVATTYFVILFTVMIVDIVNFFKYLMLAFETGLYAENYP